MRALTQAALTLSALALAATGAAANAHLASAQSDVIGHVYVNDNTATANSVAGYDRHADGSLTPIDGSPFAIGGAGTGSGLAAQGALQLSGDGRYLLAADAGSNQISVLRIRPDGGLRPAEGSPVATGGVKPVSIAVHGNLVYVANTGSGGATYSGFSLNPGGHLTPLDNASIPAAPGVVDVFISPDGTRLAGTRVGVNNGSVGPIDGTIDSFAVNSNGSLTPAAGSPFTAQANGPFGSAFNPANSGQLFVSNAHAGPGKGSVSAFAVAADGGLTPIGGSPYPNFQTAPCWLEAASDGGHLYTSNTANNSISEYAIHPDGSLALAGNTTLNGTSPTVANTRPIDLRLAPDGKNLYVIKAGINAVGALAVNGDGSLAELSAPAAALPAGVTGFASGIVVD